MGAAEIDVFSVGGEVRTGASAFPGADELAIGSVDVHRENLLIGETGLASLVGDFIAVEVEIGFGVLTPEGELFNVSEVEFAGFGSPGF